MEKEKELLKFMALLNTAPKESDLVDTADKKAKTMGISFIESTLDELFLGQWDTHSFTYQVVFNEVVGSLILEITHPITGKQIKRTGAGAIQITQDANTKVSDFLQHKKSNALDLSFPKLKAECLKNAAQSLGKIFGRDLNRKKQDSVNPLFLSNSIEIKKRYTNDEMLRLETICKNGGVENIKNMLKLYDIVDDQLVIINELISNNDVKQLQ